MHLKSKRYRSGNPLERHSSRPVSSLSKSPTPIAVWNGLPAKGLGGTGDIVSYAKQLGVPVIHLALVTREIFKL